MNATRDLNQLAGVQFEIERISSHDYMEIIFLFAFIINRLPEPIYIHILIDTGKKIYFQRGNSR